MHIFSEYNNLYLFALSFVLLIGLIEIISLIFGHLFSGIIDAHLNHYDSLTSGNIGQVLHYLNIGKIPALVVLCLLGGYFGFFGIIIQHLWMGLMQSPLNNFLLAPACLLVSAIAVHYTGKAIAPWLPVDETSAITEDDFIGKMAIVTGHYAESGRPCEGKFTDKFGQTHYLLLEPEAGKELKKGDRVLIILRLTSTRYLAELNPWPDIL